MNVVIITTKHERYHRYLCVEVAKRHQVVGILNPTRRPVRAGLKSKWTQHRKGVQKHGAVWYLLQKLANNKLRSVGWNLSQDVSQAEQRYFPTTDAEYQTLVADRVHDVQDINSAAGVRQLKDLKPDAVICSGGPIYRAPLIEAAGTMLNFHTGISPIYNGAWTVFWTYANRQPQLTGGTLMKMSTKVDGGDILAHYFPSVEADDTPGTLFMKSIIGGTALYNQFLDDMAAGREYFALPQGRPFHNYYDYEWTAYQTLAIQRHIRNRICAKFVRDEIVAKYWDAGDLQVAKQALRKTLLEVVYNAE